MTDPDHAARWALDDEELESLMIGATPDDLGRVGNPVAEFFVDARNARGVRQPSPDGALIGLFGGDLAGLDAEIPERPRMSAPPHPGGNGSSDLFRGPGDDLGLSSVGGSGWSGPEAAPITGAHDVRPRRGAHDAAPVADDGFTIPAAAGDPFAGRPDDPFAGRPDDPFAGVPSEPLADDPFAGRPNDPFGERPNDPFGERPADPYGPRPGGPFADDPYGAPTIADAPLRGSLLAERTAAHNRLVVPPTEAPATSVGAFFGQVFEPTTPKVLMGVATVAVLLTGGALLGVINLPFLGGGGVDNQAITGLEAQTEGGIVGQESETGEPAIAEQSSTVPADAGSSVVTVPLPDVATPLTASTTTVVVPRNTTTPTIASPTTESTVEETTSSVEETTSTVDPSSTTETTDPSTSSTETTETTVEETTTTTVEETTTTESTEPPPAENNNE